MESVYEFMIITSHWSSYYFLGVLTGHNINHQMASAYTTCTQPNNQWQNVEACRLGYWWYLESWKKDPETFHPHKLLFHIKGKPHISAHPSRSLVLFETITTIQRRHHMNFFLYIIRLLWISSKNHKFRRVPNQWLATALKVPGTRRLVITIETLQLDTETTLYLVPRLFLSLQLHRLELMFFFFNLAS